MKEVMNHWRGFINPDLSPIIKKRLEEALTRRQFLAGTAAVALLYAIMNSDYFKALTDQQQDELIQASPEELASLGLEDPAYIKAVREYEREETESPRDKYEGLSSREIKDLQFSTIGKLMIAPTKLPDDREWRLAPTSQSQVSGYYAYATELDLDLIAETNPEITKAMDLAYDFYKGFGLTRLMKYVYGQPEFFSYTTMEKANEGQLFDTIETEATQTNYLTGKTENIKVRKLPLAWTVANRVLIDQVSFLESELQEAKTDEEIDAVLERYGVGTEYGSGYSKTSKYDVVKKLKRIAGNSLSRIEDDSRVVGKHSN
tara:strand:- start:212 stop:1162 length:951 start_codon:yes stop_codon:yes gene_type:complete